MYRLALVVAAAFLLSGCAGQQPTARATSSPSATPTARLPSDTSPVASPAPARNPILVFVTKGSVALVRPDGTVVASIPTVRDSGEVAQHQFGRSDAALIGHYWDADGNQTSPLAISLLDRTGRIVPLAPAAATLLADTDIWSSPIVFDGHYALVLKGEVFPSPSYTAIARYLALDLTSGKVTVLLSATNLPPGPTSGLDGPPPSVDITPLGTTGDGSVARVMVAHVAINGQSIEGRAYFEVDLASLRVSGPHSLPNVGPLAMSADGRYIGWTDGQLHIRDLTTGVETTASGAPYSNETAHGGIRFSPDDAYVLVEGYGTESMGFAVFDRASGRLMQSIALSEPDEPNADVPVWWTDGHTVVYQSLGSPSGHRIEVVSGAVADYAAELGAPVLMLG
jgi:hypothetical protein